jgi:hypothetical protein
MMTEGGADTDSFTLPGRISSTFTTIIESPASMTTDSPALRLILNMNHFQNAKIQQVADLALNALFSRACPVGHPYGQQFAAHWLSVTR